MKWLASLVVAAAVGFVGAMLLVHPGTGATTPVSAGERMPIPLTSPGRQSVPGPEGAETNSAMARLVYDDIFAQPGVFDQIYVAVLLAAQASEAELHDYVQRSQETSDDFVRLNLGGLFVERLTQMDGQAAYNFVTGASLSQTYFVPHVITSWARNDPEVALAFFTDLAENPLKQEIRQRLLTDPVLQQSGLLEGLSQDLTKAQSTQLELTGLNRMLPADAFESALGLDPVHRYQALRTAIGRWYMEDPAGALQRVEQLPEVSERNMFRQWLLLRMAQHDVDQALSYAQRLEGAADMTSAIVHALAQSEPQRALDYVQQYIQSSNRLKVTGDILSIWARKDPEAVIAFVNTHDVSPQTLANIAASFSSVRPEAAIEWASGLSSEYQQAKQVAYTTAVSKEPGLAESLIGKIQDPGLKIEILSAAGRARGQADVEDALDWVQGYAREEYYGQLRSNLLANFAHRDPEAVADAISAAPGSPGSNAAIPAVAGAWARKNSDAASAWLDDLPDSAQKTAGVTNLVYAVARFNVDRAIDLAADHDVAPDQRLNVGNYLAQQAPDRVAEIARRLDLDEDFVAQFRNRPVQNRGRNAQILNRKF